MASRIHILRPTRARRALLAWFLLALPMAAAACLYGADLCTRAILEERIMAEMVANTTVGRQALVSSCWVTPLPILLKLPLYAYLDPLLPHAASRLLPVAALAALWLLLNSHLRSFGIGRLRWLIASAPLASPHLIAAALAGSNAPLTALFATITVATLLHWTTTRQLRHLGAFGFATAALAGCAPTIVPWLLAVIVLLAILESIRAASPAEARATLLLALIPLLYAWSVWATMNWLIMGNPLYFVANLPRLASSIAWEQIALPDAFHLADWLTLILASAATAALFVRRQWQAASLILLAALLIPLARILEMLDLTEADPIPVLCLLPILALLLPQLARERPRYALLLPGLLLLLLLAADHYQFHLATRSLHQRQDAASLSPDRQLLPHVATYVRARTNYAKVFVIGYQGLSLLRDNTDPLFLPSLDFNFNQNRQSYYGQTLYILVHAPTGLAATDSIHWIHPGIHRLGSLSTLYATEWGNWRLFEIIQAPLRQ